MTTNILLRLEKPHHVECLKTFMISCVDDLKNQSSEDKFHFILMVTEELKDFVEEVMTKLKESLMLESLSYQINGEELPEHREVSVRSIVLPMGLTSGNEVKITPELFKEKMSKMETTCKFEPEIWTFEEADDVANIIRYCYSQVVQILDFTERVMEDIKERLVPSGSLKDPLERLSSEQKSEQEPVPEPVQVESLETIEE